MRGRHALAGAGEDHVSELRASRCVYGIAYAGDIGHRHVVCLRISFVAYCELEGAIEIAGYIFQEDLQAERTCILKGKIIPANSDAITRQVKSRRSLDCSLSHILSF